LGGIVALLGYESSISRILVRKMCKAMEARGPDDSGWFVGEDVTLGNVGFHKDFTKKIHQPLCNRNGSIWISFDGELYNSAQLKRRFGYDKSILISDAELILKIYEKSGQNCLRQIDGIFALCIWDLHKRLVLCARDRFGVRPLYYYRNHNECIFASEIKVLFADSEVPHLPNDSMIREYLLTGDHCQNGDTFFAQVKEMLPGYYAAVDMRRNRFQVKRYWHLPFVPFLSKRKGVSASKFLNTFQSTIKKMLPNEASFAVCLSGGIDSISIASIVDEFVRTYDIGKHLFVSAICSSKMDNEEPYIREFGLSRKAKINFVYLPSCLEWKDVKNFVYHLEEPFNHFNFYLHYRVAEELKKKKVKIAFTGNGCDGFLWGFEAHRIAYLRNLWMTKDVGTLIIELTGMVVQQDYSSLHERLSLLKMLAGILRGIFLRSRTEFGDQINFVDRSAIFLKKTYLERKIPRLAESPMDEVTKRATKDTGALERLFSAFSIEVRHPFLDPEFAKFMLLLPSNQKIRTGVRKYILRNAMKDLIPESIRKSKRKFPTSAPFIEWLINLHPEISKMLSSKAFKERNMFNKDEILEVFISLCEHKLDRGESWRFAQILWRIINVELWFEIYIDPYNELSKSSLSDICKRKPREFCRKENRRTSD
jgi:asparagine synthase (glutamine-hydrolysing)